MHLIIKEVDTYKSQKHKNKTFKEYIIYLMFEETPIEAHLELGENAKNKKIIEILNQYNLNNNIIHTVN